MRNWRVLVEKMVFILRTFCSDMSPTINNMRKIHIEDLGKASLREGESEVRVGKTHWKEIGKSVEIMVTVAIRCDKNGTKIVLENIVTRVEGVKEGDQDDLEKAKMMVEEGDQT